MNETFVRQRSVVAPMYAFVRCQGSEDQPQMTQITQIKLSLFYLSVKSV